MAPESERANLKRCTCVGQCRGKEGLGEGWGCVLELDKSDIGGENFSHTENNLHVGKYSQILNAAQFYACKYRCKPEHVLAGQDNDSIPMRTVIEFAAAYANYRGGRELAKPHETNEGPTNPTEPTLTCSEVVERLDGLVIQALEGRISTVEFRKEATAILHSWRERRVQELEERLSRYEPDPDLSQKELVQWHHTRMHEVVNRAYRVYCDTKTVFPKGLARWMGVNTEDDFSKVISEREMRKKLEEQNAYLSSELSKRDKGLETLRSRIRELEK